MTLLTTPIWIWTGTAIVAVPVLAVIAVVLWEISRAKPSVDLHLGGARVELWLSPRLPGRTDLVIVPVAPDLKPIAGSALWARGATAGRASRDAEALAPREPGDAVVVAGARYRYGRTALAVVMDTQRRYTAQWIGAAVRRAVAVAVAAGRPVTSVTIPDWTPDLMRQPREAGQARHSAASAQIAPILVEAALGLVGEVHVVRLWVRDAETLGAYREALKQATTHGQAVAA
ncbi:MAG: hypothetical protein FJX72_00385 [Armatimonadetes bacterium]|nr:hypothetical protein [Armatimonadota bacterium]